jgi:hypothetical protein
MKEKITIYHGSQNIIRTPIYGTGNRRNDYGQGFYCTEDEDLAREWSVSRERDGFANQYQLDLSGLSILDLTLPEYGILEWITILLQNRTFDIQSDFGEEARAYLIGNFSVAYERYDIIKGYRADDSYFSYAQDFLNNAISVRQLTQAMRLGNLGEQIVLKSERAFRQLGFVQVIPVSAKEWFPQKESRDQRARKAYFSNRKSTWHKGEIYVMQILDEEMKPDDARLRSMLFGEGKDVAGMDV